MSLVTGSIGWGDAATWVGAGIAIFAAVFTWQQARVARQQLRDSRAAALEDDDRRRKKAAIDLAQEWCRTEAPSPIAILRECLIACDRATLSALLNGDPISVPIAFEGEVETFFEDVLGGRARDANLRRSEADIIGVSQGYSHLIRNFFARRLNFLEVVASAFNSQLADQNLIEQFFGRILATNSSYKTAVEINPRGWPELERFYGRARSGAP
jgi:hypothetical protein